VRSGLFREGTGFVPSPLFFFVRITNVSFLYPCFALRVDRLYRLFLDFAGCSVHQCSYVGSMGADRVLINLRFDLKRTFNQRFHDA